MVLMMEAKKLTLGAWLCRKRLAAGLSQRDVANAVGLQHSTISHWESDTTIPKLTPTQTTTLCNLLQISFEDLVEAAEGKKFIQEN